MVHVQIISFSSKVLSGKPSPSIFDSFTAERWISVRRENFIGVNCFWPQLLPVDIQTFVIHLLYGFSEYLGDTLPWKSTIASVSKTDQGHPYWKLVHTNSPFIGDGIEHIVHVLLSGGFVSKCSSSMQRHKLRLNFLWYLLNRPLLALNTFGWCRRWRQM